MKNNKSHENNKSAAGTRTCANLFFSCFKISLFTLGGGAAMLPLMENEFVKNKKYLTKKEMTNVLVLTSSLPGMIAINAAILIGNTINKTTGVIAALLGILIPPITIITLLTNIIPKIAAYPLTAQAFIGMRAALCALILLVLIRLSKDILKHKREFAIAILAFVLVRIFGFSTVGTIVFSGFIGWTLFVWEKK